MTESGYKLEVEQVKRWIEALESGRYRKCTGSLYRNKKSFSIGVIERGVNFRSQKTPSSFCCLGVLSDEEIIPSYVNPYKIEFGDITSDMLWKNNDGNPEDNYSGVVKMLKAEVVAQKNQPVKAG